MFSRALNMPAMSDVDARLKVMEQFPGFICGIPVNNVEASVEEIRRCKEMGAKGVQIYTDMNGEAIDTPKYRPIFQVCEELDMPIVLHPVGGLKTPEYQE